MRSSLYTWLAQHPAIGVNPKEYMTSLESLDEYCEGYDHSSNVLLICLIQKRKEYVPQKLQHTLKIPWNFSLTSTHPAQFGRQYHIFDYDERYAYLAEYPNIIDILYMIIMVQIYWTILSEPPNKRPAPFLPPHLKHFKKNRRLEALDMLLCYIFFELKLSVKKVSETIGKHFLNLLSYYHYERYREFKKLLAKNSVPFEVFLAQTLFIIIDPSNLLENPGQPHNIIYSCLQLALQYHPEMILQSMILQNEHTLQHNLAPYLHFHPVTTESITGPSSCYNDPNLLRRPCQNDFFNQDPGHMHIFFYLVAYSWIDPAYSKSFWHQELGERPIAHPFTPYYETNKHIDGDLDSIPNQIQLINLLRTIITSFLLLQTAVDQPSQLSNPYAYSFTGQVVHQNHDLLHEPPFFAILGPNNKKDNNLGLHFVLVTHCYPTTGSLNNPRCWQLYLAKPFQGHPCITTETGVQYGDYKLYGFFILPEESIITSRILDLDNSEQRAFIEQHGGLKGSHVIPSDPEPPSFLITNTKIRTRKTKVSITNYPGYTSSPSVQELEQRASIMNISIAQLLTGIKQLTDVQHSNSHRFPQQLTNTEIPQQNSSTSTNPSHECSQNTEGSIKKLQESTCHAIRLLNMVQGQLQSISQNNASPLAPHAPQYPQPPRPSSQHLQHPSQIRQTTRQHPNKLPQTQPPIRQIPLH